ncbi:hypothetical protein JMA_20120 [Jeotgalibacillus malaysiensis]|uniref:Uncharacterized protein n=1 Tax=Jeotgalibacillus malaysiensis TaxID=1508404 RepID=A0A0B5ATK6_9BACL|nr:hypothetical protein JMA_20120 [Jeotgalibacillus malaysiensis]
MLSAGAPFDGAIPVFSCSTISSCAKTAHSFNPSKIFKNLGSTYVKFNYDQI